MPSSKADTTQQTETTNAASPNRSGDQEPTATGDAIVTIDRRRPNSDRRGEGGESLDVGVMPNRRRKKQRRRHIDPTTCERDYSDPEIEFMRAMDDYKRKSGRMFPTCSEVLEVVRDLGYVRLTEQQLADLGLVDADEDEAAVDAIDEDELLEEQTEV